MAQRAQHTLPRSLHSSRQRHAPIVQQTCLRQQLQPSLASSCLFKARSFSATTSLGARKGTPRRRNRDGNPDRGVSPMRHTGLRQPLAASKFPLPKPVLDPDLRDKPVTDENHGLWGFFNKDRTRISSPMEDDAYGRHWRVAELRNKSWEDLHRLWWVCAKERNRIATQEVERARLKAGFGDREAKTRERTVEMTQESIKEALKERWQAWDKARKLAEQDPNVDLRGDGIGYDPYMAQEEAKERPRDLDGTVRL